MRQPYFLLCHLLCCLNVVLGEARILMYLTGQHPIPPSDPSLVADITHVALAFMPSSRFSQRQHPNNPTGALSDNDWPLFASVSDSRKKFPKGTKILVAIGGWGDDEGFEMAARTQEGRDLWSNNVARMIESTGADGVDIDWEYPGGNGQRYLQPNQTNPTKSWQIQAFPLLLSSLRQHVGSSKLITTAVPGHPRDMLAFNPSTMPFILQSLDFLNIMTYDLMNRRDTQTSHHAGTQSSLRSIKAYESLGVPTAKMNLGFAFYVKWYKTDISEAGHKKCAEAWKNNAGIGCPTSLMEDPKTGGDLGKSGAFSWHDEVPGELEQSFEKALMEKKWDEQGGGCGYWDEQEDIWWSWEDEREISVKIDKLAKEKQVGGVFAWGLGEDGEKFEHLKTLTNSFRKLEIEGPDMRDEL
ncbi:glycoside hydrolase family 18 protein [Amylocarpus encephaloides]|uniref:chitinase n=1 Tax=Amylocarpus encephaloides TaxID=45428 RepID=A0A9P7YF29_9HELO|nr:glycoside hydrolase family 18 protein [Amylocarpus encephaloides]